jgi:hypothetical protein
MAASENCTEANKNEEITCIMQLFLWPQIFRVTFNHDLPVPEVTGLLTRASEGPPNYFRTPNGCIPNRSTLIYVEHLLACIVFKRRSGSVVAPDRQKGVQRRAIGQLAPTQ